MSQNKVLKNIICEDCCFNIEVSWDTLSKIFKFSPTKSKWIVIIVWLTRINIFLVYAVWRTTCTSLLGNICEKLFGHLDVGILNTSLLLWHYSNWQQHSYNLLCRSTIKFTKLFATLHKKYKQKMLSAPQAQMWHAWCQGDR